MTTTTRPVTTTAYATKCDDCGRMRALTFNEATCEACGGLLEICYDLSRLANGNGMRIGTGRAISRWRPLLPIPDESELVSLGEGDTPLLGAPTAAKWCGLDHLLVKNDGYMPTGSFKDRSMAVPVTVAQATGDQVLVTFSSGNAAGSLAAYAARAGIRSVAVVQQESNAFKTALVRLSGGWLLDVERTNLHAGEAYCLAADRVPLARTFMNFLNPFRHEGLKTTAYEVAEALEWQAPDYMIHPVGTGGGVWGAWRGFIEMQRLGWTDQIPRMIGVQPVTNAFVHDAIANGRSRAVPSPETGHTMAQSISARDVLRGGTRALRALRESGGSAYAVTDAEIASAMEVLAADGIAAEPAAATPVAAARQGVQSGRIAMDARVVCVATGTAFKDPESLHEVASSVTSKRWDSPVERQVFEAVTRVAEELR